MNHTITTTLNENLIEFLNKESKEKSISKKSIIEKWLELYKSYELEKAYKNMWNDKEYMEEMVENTAYLSNL